MVTADLVSGGSITDSAGPVAGSYAEGRAYATKQATRRMNSAGNCLGIFFSKTVSAQVKMSTGLSKIPFQIPGIFHPVQAL